MSLKPTDDELAFFDDISRLGASLWAKSLEVEGLNTDPKMFSVMLFKRLWSNHRGYTVHWNKALTLESDIILRSGIEAAICIAANFKLRDDFVRLIRQDAIFTLQGQIKLHRDDGDGEMVRQGEAVLRDLLARLPAGAKSAKLDWKRLAEQGCVPELYAWHRMLSGISSHVTGLSVLDGVTGDRTEEMQKELRGLTRKMHLMKMAGATLQGAMLHAGMIEDEAHVHAVLSLTKTPERVIDGLAGGGTASTLRIAMTQTASLRRLRLC